MKHYGIYFNQKREDWQLYYRLRQKLESIRLRDARRIEISETVKNCYWTAVALLSITLVILLGLSL